MKQSSMMKFEIKAFYRETTMVNLSTKIKVVERDDHALKVQAENVLNPKIEGNVENAQGPDLKIGVPAAAAPDPDHVIERSGPGLKRKAAPRKALDIARNQKTENAMKESAADLKNAIGIQELILRKMSDQ